jgi:DNA-binding transcriptional LysR family regulator
MRPVHAEAFDLNLLLAFDALWTERHVTRAARRVGLTQSAMSHALRRLRLQLEDPLFLSTPNGLKPTARAQTLAPSWSQALALVRHTLAAPQPFSPAALRRTFTIATTDYTNLVVLPRLMQRLAATAPQVQVIVNHLSDSSERALVAGEIDLVITGLAEPSHEALRGETLFADGFVSLVRAKHPAARQRLTLKRYLELQHVLISPLGGGEGMVDSALQRLGHTRHIALRVPHFLAAPLVVAATDHVVTLPERLARAVAKQHRLAIVRPPVSVPMFNNSQFWHARSDDDVAHRWLRQQVKGTVSD